MQVSGQPPVLMLSRVHRWTCMSQVRWLSMIVTCTQHIHLELGATITICGSLYMRCTDAALYTRSNNGVLYTAATSSRLQTTKTAEYRNHAPDPNAINYQARRCSLHLQSFRITPISTLPCDARSSEVHSAESTLSSWGCA